MVMKLYPEFEPAIQFAKTVGEAEYAKLMELYTAWKSGAFSNSVELGTYYGCQQRLDKLEERISKLEQ